MSLDSEAFADFSRKFTESSVFKSELLEKIELFFSPPETSRANYSRAFLSSHMYDSKAAVLFSSLYLLRRDILFGLGKNSNGKSFMTKSIEGPADFMSTAFMVNGIEFLALAITGRDNLEPILIKYFDLKDARERHALVRLRDAITHKQYGLRIDWSRREKKTTIFTLVNSSGHSMVRELKGKTHNSFVIDVDKLSVQFEIACREIKKDLLTLGNLKQVYFFNEFIRPKKYWISFGIVQVA